MDAVQWFRERVAAELVENLQPTLQTIGHDDYVVWILKNRAWRLRWDFGDALVTIPALATKRPQVVRLPAEHLTVRLQTIIDAWIQAHDALHSTRTRIRHDHQTLVDRITQTCTHALHGLPPWPSDSPFRIYYHPLHDGWSLAAAQPDTPTLIWRWNDDHHHWQQHHEAAADTVLYKAYAVTSLTALIRLDERLVQPLHIQITHIRRIHAIEHPPFTITADDLGLPFILDHGGPDDSITESIGIHPVWWIRAHLSALTGKESP